MATTNSSVLKWLNILAFVLMVFFNGLAGSTTLIGGKNTAQISDAYPTLITPAGYVITSPEVAQIHEQTYCLIYSTQNRSKNLYIKNRTPDGGIV